MDTNTIDSILLGLIQGVTEFFPISSSGHLVLAKTVLGVQDVPLLFDIFFHFATALSIVTVFCGDMLRITVSFVQYCTRVFRMQGVKNVDKDTRMVLLIVLGTVPAAIAGAVFQKSIETIFGEPHTTAIFLLVTGLILVSTAFARRTRRELGGASAFLIGIAQACALFPGVSRSGTTIAAGLWLGIKPEDAVKFSFYLAVPVIIGANVLQFSTVSLQTLQGNMGSLIAGGTAAYLSGLVGIILLLKAVRLGWFYLFGIYCLVVGTIAVVLT